MPFGYVNLSIVNIAHDNQIYQNQFDKVWSLPGFGFCQHELRPHLFHHKATHDKVPSLSPWTGQISTLEAANPKKNNISWISFHSFLEELNTVHL